MIGRLAMARNFGLRILAVIAATAGFSACAHAEDFGEPLAQWRSSGVATRQVGLLDGYVEAPDLPKQMKCMGITSQDNPPSIVGPWAECSFWLDRETGRLSAQEASRSVWVRNYFQMHPGDGQRSFNITHGRARLSPTPSARAKGSIEFVDGYEGQAAGQTFALYCVRGPAIADDLIHCEGWIGNLPDRGIGFNFSDEPKPGYAINRAQMDQLVATLVAVDDSFTRHPGTRTMPTGPDNPYLIFSAPLAQWRSLGIPAKRVPVPDGYVEVPDYPRDISSCSSTNDVCTFWLDRQTGRLAPQLLWGPAVSVTDFFQQSPKEIREQFRFLDSKHFLDRYKGKIANHRYAVACERNDPVEPGTEDRRIRCFARIETPPHGLIQLKFFDPQPPGRRYTIDRTEMDRLMALVVATDASFTRIPRARQALEPKMPADRAAK